MNTSSTITPIPFRELQIGRMFNLEEGGPTFIKLGCRHASIFDHSTQQVKASIDLSEVELESYMLTPTNPTA